MKSTIFLCGAVAFTALYLATQKEALEPDEQMTLEEAADESFKLEAALADAIQDGDTLVITKGFQKVLRMAKEQPRELIQWTFGSGS